MAQPHRSTAHPFHGVYLLDPDLRDREGHFFDYARTIEGACAELGLGFRSAGHLQPLVRFPDELHFTPAFDAVSASFVPAWLGGYFANPLLAGRRFEQQLKTRVGDAGGPRTMVFAAVANHRHYGALARWLRGIPGERAPALAVLMRQSEFDPVAGGWKPTARLSRLGLGALQETARTHRVRLLTSTEGMAAEYSQLTSLPVASVPAPHRIPARFLHAARNPRRPGPVRMGYLGGAREEKGFLLLAEAIRRLRALRAPLEFLVHCYVRPAESEAVHRAVGELARMEDARLRLVRAAVDAGAYYEMMLEVDALALPYRQREYRTRNSAVVTDAIALGRPVVVTEGTWMAGQMREHGAGIASRDDDCQSLMDALLQVASDADALRSLAGERAAAQERRHSPRTFLETLIGLFSAPLLA